MPFDHDPPIPPATPCADFTRRRVQRILNSETPRQEQHCDTTFDAWHIVERLFLKHGDYLCHWYLKNGPSFEVYCQWRSCRPCCPNAFGINYHLVKKGGANFNSRFLGRPE